MTTIQESLSFLQPATMADDNMEITSDMGHDDIDIDIDLTPDHQDEDDVLEDAKSDGRLDEDYDIELLSSPVQTHDDLMLDEENPSFLMNDGPDGISETEIIEFSETVAESHTTTDFNSTFDQQSTLLPVEADESQEVGWEQVQLEVDSDKVTYLGNEEQEDAAFQDGTEHQEKMKESQESKIFVQSSPPTESSTALETPHPDTHVPQHELTPKSTPEPGKEDIPNVGNAAGTEPVVQNPGKVDLGDPEEPGSTSEITRRVIVIYQDAEYALVSSAKSDDPDSYFLKDDSLTKAPLSNFLSALREVIVDDLTPDEELCLAVNDFDIEISEASVSTSQVTFANIIDLHTTLLLNDGVVSPGPFYISLGCKPDFSKRLAGLAAGAEEGKGLSQLVTWDEKSDSFQEDPSGFIEEHLAHNEDEPQELLLTELTGSRSDEATEDFPSQNESEKLHNTGETPQATFGSVREHHGSVPADDANISIEDGVVAKQNGEDAEEDDLIDYEDDDYEQTQHTPVSAHNLADQTSNQAVEYETINEDLHRRSLSLAAEDGAPTSSEQEGAIYSISSQEHLETNGDFVWDAAEPESEDLDGSDERGHEEHADPQEGDDEVHEVDIKEDGSGEIPTNPESHSHEQHIENENPTFNLPADPEQSFEQGEELNDYEDVDINGDEEIDFEIGPEDPDYHESQDDDSGASNRELEHNALEADEINYDEPDEAPESNESEQTMGPADAEDFPHDEIDYEDDNEPTVNKAFKSEAATSVASVSNGVTGKRPRAADDEDALDREIKDTKRSRS